MSIIARIDPAHKDFQELQGAVHMLLLGVPVNFSTLTKAIGNLEKRQNRLRGEKVEELPYAS